MTSKPQGLAKIWREIKRPFRQSRRNIDRGLRKLYYPLLRLAYKKVARKGDIARSEAEATKAIVRNALKSQDFVKTGFAKTLVQDMLISHEFIKSNATESIIQNALKKPEIVEKLFEKPKQIHNVRVEHDQKIWNEFFTKKPEELKKLQHELIADTDELSGEIVTRYIARRRFFMKYGNSFMWNIFSKLFHAIYPLDYEEQERIKSLVKEYRCPYKLPCYAAEHMVLGCGLNEFSLEVQRKIAGKDVIDGGGFLGDSAMIFTEYHPRKVYVFEPNPDTVSAMNQVVMENKAVLGNRKDRIEIVPLALGKAQGQLSLYSNGNSFDPCATVLSYGHGTKSHEVDVISIDEFVEKYELGIGLIKLDIEGAEYDTILGAKETIIKQKPLLLISIYHSFKDFFEIKPLIEGWGVGYKFAIRHHSPSHLDGEFMLMGYVP